MSSSQKKGIRKTIQFGLASLIGNAFMAFLVYKLIVKENPRVTRVDMTLMIAVILLITVIEVIVFGVTKRTSLSGNTSSELTWKRPLKGIRFLKFTWIQTTPFINYLRPLMKLVNTSVTKFTS
ncbi:hypothetical protein V6R94_01810 [Pediococcus acidilactici]